MRKERSPFRDDVEWIVGERDEKYCAGDRGRRK